MASPWRGNKQTKQQQRRQRRRRQQHQIGKSKLHVLHGRRWTRSSSSSSTGSGPVAFLVSRKFTAASHPFCLGSLCVASSALFVYFFCFFFLSLLLYRNFICWRIFHRLVRQAAAGKDMSVYQDQQQDQQQHQTAQRVWELNL